MSGLGNAKTTLSNKDDAEYPGQTEISVGIRNEIYVSALGKWKYYLHDAILYGKSLGCVGPAGANQSSSPPKDTDAFSSVSKLLKEPQGKDLVSTFMPNVSDVGNKLRTPSAPPGYRIIMDKDRDGIVSGTDGYTYVVSKEEAHDLSAAWRSTDVGSGKFDLDVFGRILASYSRDDGNNFYSLVADLRLFKPEAVNVNFRAASFTVLKDGDKDLNLYGLTVTLNDFQKYKSADPNTGSEVFYPVACQTGKGLRLLGLKYPLETFHAGTKYRFSMVKADDSAMAYNVKYTLSTYYPSMLITVLVFGW